MLEDQAVAEFVTSKPDLFGAIKKSVEQMVRATVPEGKSFAVIAHADLEGHLTFGVAGKVGDHWEFDATLEKALGAHTPMTAQVSVIFTA